MDAGPAPDDVVAVFMHGHDHGQCDDKRDNRVDQPAKLRDQRDKVQLFILPVPP